MFLIWVIAAKADRCQEKTLSGAWITRPIAILWPASYQNVGQILNRLAIYNGLDLTSIFSDHTSASNHVIFISTICRVLHRDL